MICVLDFVPWVDPDPDPNPTVAKLCKNDGTLNFFLDADVFDGIWFGCMAFTESRVVH